MNTNAEKEAFARAVIGRFYQTRWLDEGIKTYVLVCGALLFWWVSSLVQGTFQLKDLGTGLGGLALGLLYIPLGRFCWWVILGVTGLMFRPVWVIYNKVFWGIAVKKVFAQMDPDDVLVFLNSKAGRQFLVHAFHFESEAAMLASMQNAED